MNFYTLLKSKLASISSSTIKGVLVISFIERKNARLAKDASPAERESVPIVYAFWGGIAVNIKPP